MKKIYLIILSVFIVGVGFSQNLRAYLTYSMFNTPENEPYIETYLTINGASIKYKKLEDGNYQGIVEVQLLFKKNDSIVNFAKYALNSPIVSDSQNLNQNMLDIQRYGLPNGDYTLDVSLRDVYSKGDTMSSSDDFTINFSDNEVEFSDIELLTNYEKADKDSPGIKNGYLLTPYVFNYYPETMSKVSFYAELYNTKKIIGSDPFLLTYYIRPFEIEKPLDKYIIRKRANAEDVNVVLGSFNIENLPSGNYLLVMEARNRNNEVIASKEVYFQRYNPDSNFNLNDMMVLNPQNTFVDKITNKDSMQMYIDYLSPISTEIERAYATGLIGSASLEELQKYFLNFWYERNSSDPEGEWNDYLVMVNHANEEFTSHRKLGYKSDRGRVFLQYGKPNVISDHHFEPAAYPYEIWHYYQLGNQRDKKFVFYAHDRGTNDFQLIHSNAIGELNNYRWQTVIYRRTWDPQSIDDSQIPDTWGGKATQSYRQPW